MKVTAILVFLAISGTLREFFPQWHGFTSGALCGAGLTFAIMYLSIREKEQREQ